MKSIHTSIVTDAHAYTRDKLPWQHVEYKSDYGDLIRYLSGGGMRAFGRTIAQDRARRRHRRFYVISAVLFAIWLVFYLF